MREEKKKEVKGDKSFMNAYGKSEKQRTLNETGRELQSLNQD